MKASVQMMLLRESEFGWRTLFQERCTIGASGTESAVQAFQSERGLNADGVVAHDTWVALRSAE